MRTNDGGIAQERALLLGILISLLGVLAMAGGSLRGQATQPAVPTQATTRPAPSPNFSDEEVALIDSVKDYDADLLTAPLSVLLKHAAMLPDDAHAKKVDLVALLVAPQEYREKLKPVAFEGWYAGLCETKEAVGKEEWWPPGTFYLMHVAVTSTKDASIVLVALTKAPPPSMIRGTKVYFTAYFYKNALLPLCLNEATKRVNPLLVAKGVALSPRPTTAPATRPAQAQQAPGPEALER